MTDLEIIAAVDDLAGHTNAHRSRAGEIRRAWEAARESYLKRTGIDVLDAIKRHEAWLRNPDNAPELYVEKR